MDAPREGTGERHQKLEEMFLSALPHIDHAVKFVAHRHRLSSAELEAFAGDVKLAFIDQDYAVFERFAGRSSLRTYLVTVVQRLFIDHLRRRFGRWRPSARARRLGVLAVRLEALLYRDHLSFTEACEMLRTNDGVTESDVVLRDLAQQLPPRSQEGARPRHVEDGAEPRASTPSEPDGLLSSRETVDRCQRGLEAALRELDPEDRLLIRLRFEDGVSVADMARELGLDQKSLYRRLERLLADLRNVLLRHRLSWPEVQVLIDDGTCHVRLPPEDTEIEGPRPSQSQARS